MWDKISEWWRSIFLFEWNGRLRYAWLWKFLVSWDKGITIGFYPDYEHCRFEVTLWTGSNFPPAS